jgi:hypothetical protein
MNRQGFGVFVACTIDSGIPNLEKMVIWLQIQKLMVIASHLYANQCDFEALCIFTRIHVHGLIYLVL